MDFKRSVENAELRRARVDHDEAFETFLSPPPWGDWIK